LVLRGHTARVIGVAFTPEGRRLASASEDSSLKVWDAASGECLLTLPGHTKPVTGVAFHPEGKQMASASRDETIKTWNAGTGENLLTLRVTGGPVLAIAFSPDGRRLASAGQDGRVRIWDANSGKELLTLGGPGGAVRCLAFRPDGRLLASAGEGQEIKLWDATSGEELPGLRGRSGTVLGLAFGRDGRLAAANTDKTINVWDTTTAQQLVTLQGHPDSVSAVAFSPDGWQLASGSIRGGMKVWDGRPLTADHATHREALALLEWLCSQPLPPAEVLAHIRADRTIREAVRQRALDLPEPYQQALVRREADCLIHSLSHQALPKQDLLDAVRATAGLTEVVRQEALAQAERYVENPDTLNETSRVTVRQRDREPAAF